MRYALVCLLVIACNGAAPAPAQPAAPPSPGSIFDPPPGSPPPAPPAAPKRDVPSPPVVPEVQPRRIDLLALTDVPQDVVHGKWKLKSDATMQQDGVEFDNAKVANLEFPYQPPAEYDVIAVFQPQAEHDVNLLGVQSGHPFQLNVGSLGKWAGLDPVHGVRDTGPGNPTHVELHCHPKRLYTLVLQVRRDRIRGLLNGAVFVDYKTDGSIALQGPHFFTTFSRAAEKIAVREWPARADYEQGKEPISIGVLDVP